MIKTVTLSKSPIASADSIKTVKLDHSLCDDNGLPNTRGLQHMIDACNELGKVGLGFDYDLDLVSVSIDSVPTGNMVTRLGVWTYEPKGEDVNATYVSVGMLREFVNKIPRSRDEEPVALYDLDDGSRFNIENLDSDIEGAVDINFNSKEDK